MSSKAEYSLQDIIATEPLAEGANSTVYKFQDRVLKVYHSHNSEKWQLGFYVDVMNMAAAFNNHKPAHFYPDNSNESVNVFVNPIDNVNFENGVFFTDSRFIEGPVLKDINGIIDPSLTYGMYPPDFSFRVKASVRSLALDIQKTLNLRPFQIFGINIKINPAGIYITDFGLRIEDIQRV